MTTKTAAIKDAMVIALVPCPYKRCASESGIPCVNTDMSHKARAIAARRKIVTVTSYHGIGWTINPGDKYERHKPQAIERARMIAPVIGAKLVLVYKDDGELQRTIKIG